MFGPTRPPADVLTAVRGLAGLAGRAPPKPAASILPARCARSVTAGHVFTMGPGCGPDAIQVVHGADDEDPAEVRQRADRTSPVHHITEKHGKVERQGDEHQARQYCSCAAEHHEEVVPLLDR